LATFIALFFGFSTPPTFEHNVSRFIVFKNSPWMILQADGFSGMKGGGEQI
jgi:hypothetical protein